MLTNKKVLITGASGFIGSVLLRKTLKKYPKATIFIFLRKTSNVWRIKDILSGVKVVETDLSDKKRVQKACLLIRPDIIFHLAAYGAYHYQRSIDEAIKTNYLGTVNLLLALDKINYRIFVNTGSSSEYGYKKEIMSESDLLEPNSYYATTKAAATSFCFTHALLNQKPIITLRPFAIYGPYEEPGRLIPTAIARALKDETINVVKNSVRDFVYIDDMINAYYDCVNLKTYKNKIFNICSGEQTNIPDVIGMIRKLTKSRSKMEISDYKLRPWDTNFWVGNNHLAKSVLKWKPQHSLKDGLFESIQWYSKIRENDRFVNKYFPK